MNSVNNNQIDSFCLPNELVIKIVNNYFNFQNIEQDSQSSSE